jgi:hypothetical protein
VIEIHFPEFSAMWLGNVCPSNKLVFLTVKIPVVFYESKMPDPVQRKYYGTGIMVSYGSAFYKCGYAGDMGNVSKKKSSFVTGIEIPGIFMRVQKVCAICMPAVNHGARFNPAESNWFRIVVNLFLRKEKGLL